MDSDILARLATHFGLRIDDAAATHGMSGSHVLTAHRPDGQRCVLKVTARDRPDRIRGAERELAVYRDLAGQLPVRLPALLDWYADDTVIAMAISAHGAIVPATAWSGAAWQALALDLAHLHATTPPETDFWQGCRMLPQAFLEPDLPMIDAFWRATLGPDLDTILADRDHLEQAIRAAGNCLVHGDCHTENILLEGRDLVWIDWQSTRVGNPALELAFPGVRAAPAGVRVPAAFLPAYCRERGIDHDAMQRSVTAAALCVFVFEWPPYAAFDTPDETDRVRQQTRELADAWLGRGGAMEASAP